MFLIFFVQISQLAGESFVSKERPLPEGDSIVKFRLICSILLKRPTKFNFESIVLKLGRKIGDNFLLLYIFIHRASPSVHLQTDNFLLFLRQQMDKRQTSVCTMSKR
jgi:hypothetical protein